MIRRVYAATLGRVFNGEELHVRSIQAGSIYIIAGYALGVSAAFDSIWPMVGCFIVATAIAAFGLWWHPSAETVARQWEQHRANEEVTET